MLLLINMGSVKGLRPALGPLMVCFNGFQQGTPLLVIITMEAPPLTEEQRLKITKTIWEVLHGP